MIGPAQIAKMRLADGSLPAAITDSRVRAEPAAESSAESSMGRKGLQMMTLLPQSAARTGDPNRDPTSR